MRFSHSLDEKYTQTNAFFERFFLLEEEEEGGESSSASASFLRKRRKVLRSKKAIHQSRLLLLREMKRDSHSQSSLDFWRDRLIRISTGERVSRDVTT